eukprot:259176-Amorphochlora_amoeboformis.AAC.1
MMPGSSRLSTTYEIARAHANWFRWDKVRWRRCGRVDLAIERLTESVRRLRHVKDVESRKLSFE